MIQRHLLLGFAFVFTSAMAAQLNAQPVQIDVSREGREYRVVASAEVTADVQTAWDTLSDYAHLPDFVPDISSSRVVERDGNHLVVEYFGTLRYFIFSAPVAVRLSVQQTPWTQILAHSDTGVDPSGAKSTVESIESSYSILPLAPHLVRITYNAHFVPASSLPSFIALRAVRHTITQQFESMLEEMARRQSLLAQP